MEEAKEPLLMPELRFYRNFDICMAFSITQQSLSNMHIVLDASLRAYSTRVAAVAH